METQQIVNLSFQVRVLVLAAVAYEQVAPQIHGEYARV